MHRVVPQIIIDNYRAGRYAGKFSAVGLFLDLSGFSSMTDTLMQHGQHGAEVLAGLMHGVFDPLVESIFEYGGKVVGFAGDGIMALFPLDDIPPKDVALRALAAASEVQSHLFENPVRQTPYGNFQFSVKVGLAVGDVAWGILRSIDEESATYYFRGTAVDESAKAEQQASAGEILFTDSMLRLLSDSVQTQPVGSFHRCGGFRHGKPSPSPTNFPSVDLDISKVFFPEEIVSQDVRGEFRQVVNLFMRFPELEGDELEQFFRVVFELRQKFGGLLNRLDFGDKGCNMLMLWGAPMAYENDIGRVLNFILELKSRVKFPITAGITYYIAHAGYLGSSMSEDYTCYGWGVNLAARFMMSASTGHIWVDDRIARRVSAWFEIEFLGVQKFKGFSSEQKVHVLKSRRVEAESIYQGEMVGRGEELSRCLTFAEPLWKWQFPGALLLLGDPGMGKGRLLHEFRTMMMHENPNIQWGVLQADQILRQSFNPIRYWLLRYFDIAAAESLEKRIENFETRMQRVIAMTPDQDLALELDRLRSMLAALVDLYWEGSLYETLDAKSRYNSTLAALIYLIEAESLIQPLVLVLEDAHYIDEDTLQFLPRLKRALQTGKDPYPVALVVTSRLQGNPFTADEALADVSITLGRLSEEAVARQLDILLGGPSAAGLTKVVLDRSEGNPFFIEQIVRYLQEESLIETRGDGWALSNRVRDLFLPGDIRAMLVARLDQLDMNVKEIVQTAAILGRVFSLPVLTEMSGNTSLVEENVREAEQHAVWKFAGENKYIFSHGLLRDAAYTMQMRAHRQELHRLAVNALEKNYGAEVQFHYAELAHHAELGELKDKALHFYALAGKASADAYQNNQAIEYFTRAFSFTAFDDYETQFRLLQERVNLYGRIGNRSLQVKDLELLEKIAVQLRDDRQQASVWRLYAHYYFTIGDYQNTLQTSERVIEMSMRLEDPEIALGIYLVRAQASFRLGRVEEAIARQREGLELARALKNRVEEGRSLTALGLIMLESRQPAQAVEYMENAVEIAREVGDRVLESRALGNLANAAAYVLRDYIAARDYYNQAQRLAVELGDRFGEGVEKANIGWVNMLLGDYETARAELEGALSIAREVDHSYQEIYTLLNLSAVNEAQGNVEGSEQYAAQAMTLSLAKGDKSGEAWSYYYLGNALLGGGQLDEARSAFAQAVEMRTEQNQPSLAKESLAGLIRVALANHDHALAVQYANEVMEYLANGGTLDGAEEPLRIYLACFNALDTQHDPRCDDILAVARDLLHAQTARISVVSSRRRFIDNVPWRREIMEHVATRRG
ncbi:MAG TPA: tetratricopeptide repeat protein [Anaerolineales bacterium]|nr:tetratricopeptide repeat protein [Anaerolineales bacterium]HMS00459.1 tetratricopeptide repeat protein [Anaerolineales bacterium]HNQ94169.1 tetratricopeptide repeat protein [Anaerolineales bacterium]HNS59670.1 tetratricopeptide repeat protein [Anaerolineales bacterium]